MLLDISMGMGVVIEGFIKDRIISIFQIEIKNCLGRVSHHSITRNSQRKGLRMSESKLADARINTFGPIPKADVPPLKEAVFVLSTSELKAIISAAVAEALKTALERVSDMEADIITLRAEIVDLRASGEAEITRVCEEIAFDRQRLRQLEQSRTQPTKKTTDHLDELARMMSEDKTCQISIAKAARLLDLSKERMRQLKPLISHDSRFELAWDRQRGQPKRIVIRLRQYIRANDGHAKFAIGIAD